MKDGKSVFVVLALTIFIVYVMRNFLGKLSAFFFVPIDNLLFISHRIPPVLMWMIMGLLVGLVYGSFIAIKKFRLDYKLLIMPLAVLTVMFILIKFAYYLNQTPGSGEETVTKNIPIPELTKPSSNIYGFDQNIIKGIRAVESEEYADAEFFFKEAAGLDKNNPRLDSLANIYSKIGNSKCQLYSKDVKLKYIANNYYKYAAALTGKSNPEVCK